MKKITDLTGQKFGKLTVIKKDEDYISPLGRKLKRWICKCDCGNSISVIGNELKKNKAKQCKKCRCKAKQINGYISSNYFCNLKRNAKIRDIYFDPKIDRKYLWELFLKQNKKCALSNLPIHFSERSRRREPGDETTSSLDRIDNSKGYIKNNIQWVHKHINQMKWDLNQKDFFKICKSIYEYNKKNPQQNYYPISQKIINFYIFLIGKIQLEKITNTITWQNIRRKRKKNIEVSPLITKEYLWILYLLQNKKCALSGQNIYLAASRKDKKENTASVDRIDSSKGYIPENVQWVHKKINKMKYNYPQDHFIKLCEKVAKNNK